MNPEIIVDISLIAIGLYLAFFKSYFQEKGKNIATGEDIEKLTLKVESVKQNFIERNASLKAKLDLLTNLQINHKNDERNALINFHKKLKSWIGLLSEPSPTVEDDYDNQQIQAKIFQLDLIYNDMLGAQALLELYVDDKELNKLIYNLKTNVLKHLSLNPTKCLFELKKNNLDIQQQEKMPNDTDDNIIKKSEKFKELLDRRKLIYDEYRENLINGYKKINKYDNEYKTYMKDYISRISSE